MSDTVYSGNENLIGGAGSDTLSGGDGADFLNGGSGNDSLDGGSGIDRLLGGSGSDTLIFRAWENQTVQGSGSISAYDVYDGGTGSVKLGSSTPDVDTLVIYLSPEQMADESFMALFNSQLAAFKAFITANTSSKTLQAGQATFTFTCINLKVSAVENVEVRLDPTAPLYNRAPTAVADAAETDEDTSVTIDVLDNDSDPDATDTLSISSASLAEGSLGSVSIVNGQLVYAPGSAYNDLAAGESATVTINYSISDGNDGTSSATATVTVTGSNDGPTAVNDTVQTGYGVPIKIFVLENDEDPDGDVLVVDSIVTNPTKGQITLNDDNTFTYTPNNGATGADSFTYRISDGNGGFSTATVNVNIGSPADPITYNVGPLVISKDAIATFNVAQLLAHDGLPGNEGQSIVAAVAFDSNANRTPIVVTINADGTISLPSGTLATGQFKGYVSFTLSNGDVLTARIEVVNVTGGGGNFDGATTDPLGGTNLDGYWASYLDAQEGPDTLLGGSGGGYDVFVSGGGIDTLMGSAGNDTLRGGAGNDTIDGGVGVDLLDFSDATAGVVITLIQSASDTVFNASNAAGTGTDTYRNMEGVLGSAHADTITGSSSADALYGNSGNDTLEGRDGGDTLFGDAGADTIRGEEGADVINGGVGNDVLTGGSGGDVFQFESVLNSSSNLDRITDFNSADDTIGLNRSIFGGIAADGTLHASAFHVGTGAGDADDRIIYNAATGDIFYDVDGTGSTAAILFAQVAPNTWLTSADFFVYG